MLCIKQRVENFIPDVPLDLTLRIKIYAFPFPKRNQTFEYFFWQVIRIICSVHIFLSPPSPLFPLSVSFLRLLSYWIFKLLRKKYIQNANLKILFVYFSKIIWSFKMFCYVQKRDMGNFLFQFLFPFHRIFYWYYKP